MREIELSRKRKRRSVCNYKGVSEGVRGCVREDIYMCARERVCVCECVCVYVRVVDV